METKTVVSKQKKRALEALERRFVVAKAEVQQQQIRNKRRCDELHQGCNSAAGSSKSSFEVAKKGLLFFLFFLIIDINELLLYFNFAHNVKIFHLRVLCQSTCSSQLADTFPGPCSVEIVSLLHAYCFAGPWIFIFMVSFMTDCCQALSFELIPRYYMSVTHDYDMG